MQLKSSYFLEGIKSKFLNHFKGEILLSNDFHYTDNWERTIESLQAEETIRKKLERELEEKQNQFYGLINWLSWFHTDREIELPEIPNPILSVLNNLISRGEFTKPSLFIERTFAEAFQKTTVEVDEDTGSINSNLIDNTGEFFNSIWTALHVIDTTPQCDNANNIELGDPNSTFENWFLSDFITDDNSYIRQILQQQRTLNSICLPQQQNGFTGNRVDFSIECPYYFSDEIAEYFWKKNFIIKRRHGLVIELDGPQHTLAPESIHDNNRDTALNLSKWTVRRIASANQVTDSTNAISTLLQTPFVQTIKKNFEVFPEERKLYTQIALSPIAIARVQKTIIRKLISFGETLFDKSIYKVAIIERDVPCGFIAVKDLNEQIKNLSLLKGENNFPNLEVTVFSDSDYSDSPLQRRNVLSVSSLNLSENDFDFIIDTSILRREGIFLDDYKFNSEKTIVIRTTHFAERKNENILCSDLIKYKEIVRYRPDGTYEEHETEKQLLTFFLQNVFRKNSFRIGQLPIINRALQLKSVIGLLPTGGGKSLTYQLAAILQPGITLVVDPIRSLMINQFQNLSKLGIENCNFINSTLDTIERGINISKLEKGEIQFCFISPERLVTDEFRRTLKECGEKKMYFSYCVIDEVHCVSEWGHDFRTPYLSLGKNARKFCPTFKRTFLQEDFQLPLYGLTATASFDVLADVERELEILSTEVDETIVSFENTLREEIQYSLIQTDVDLAALPPPAGQNVWLDPNLNNLKGAAFYGNLKFFNPPHVDALGNVIGDKPLTDEIGKRKQNEVIDILQNQFLQDWNYYSNEAIQNDLLHISFTEYLDEKQKANFNNDEETYIQEKKLDIIQQGGITADNIWDNNIIGFIIFAPHRTGYFGVTDKFKKDPKGNPIPVAKRHGIYDKVQSIAPSGIFMGSGDESDEKTSAEIQSESLICQESFINSDIAIMVATKAFGMGIDKPNIRSTIHVNMPSSLESFVQESGRAGRDGKLAISYLLFNQQKLKYFTPRTYRNLFSGNTKHGFERKKVQLPDYATCLQLRQIANANQLNDRYRYLKQDFETILTNIQNPLLDNAMPPTDLLSNREKLNITAEDQWVDFDILEFFHYNSFKGIKKELVILDELLNEISFPQRQKLKEIEEEFFEETEIKLACKFSTDPNYERYIWISDEEGRTYGYLRTDTFNVSWKKTGGIEQDNALSVLNQFKNFILQHPDFIQLTTNQQRHDLLKTMVLGGNREGLIHALQRGEMQLYLGLLNRYFQTKDNKGDFIPNSPWLNQMIKTLKSNFPEINALPDTDVVDKFLKNIFSANQTPEPISSVEDLWNNIEKYYQLLPNYGQNYDVNLLHSQQRETELAKAFYSDRNSADTLKAIYRLLSIGIVNDYEIDYRKKTVLLKFSSDGAPGIYRSKLKEFIRRYYSEVQSQNWIDQLNIENENDIAETLTKSLKILIEFVYNETEEKRFQGIKEMVEAIQRGLPQPHESPIEGNKRFKEEIYYYFNAKYARRYVLPTGEPASLVADTARGTISNFDICEKYLRVLEEDNGAYLSNLKHLRGSTQKILRAVNQNNACLKILKAFSLYQLSQNQTYFIDEVVNPVDGLFVTGFVSMFQESNWELSQLQDALRYIENESLKHFPEHRFQNEWRACIESIYLKHHNWWLSNFINRINQ